MVVASNPISPKRVSAASKMAVRVSEMMISFLLLPEFSTLSQDPTAQETGIKPADLNWAPA